MEQNSIRKVLSDKLEVTELELDINRLSAELLYHKSKTKIFENTIKAKQVDLDDVLGVPIDPKKMGEIYKWR